MKQIADRHCSATFTSMRRMMAQVAIGVEYELGTNFFTYMTGSYFQMATEKQYTYLRQDEKRHDRQ